ncbi:MAG: rhomboid family intramembrane serine protease, partial [Methylococcaceae bacterium]
MINQLANMLGYKCWPIKTLIMVLMMYLLWVFFGPAPEQLIYDRALISQGEIWRLLTAHLVHLDSEHLILNLAALLVLGSLLEYLQ